MSDEIVIDKNSFHTRLSAFVTQWKSDKRSDALFSGIGSIFICVGKASDGAYPKSAAFQLWLLGYEFPATLFVITQDALHIVTTKKKASFLEGLKGGKVPVEIHIRGKDADENAEQLKKCAEIIKSSGKKVGVLTKEAPQGPFADEWKKAYGEISGDLEETDIALIMSNAALAVKDEKELRAIRDASRASSGIMKDYFVDEMSGILDEEKKIPHSKLAQQVADKIDDSKFFQKLKVSSSFDPMNLDWATQPVVQSGGSYDLKFNTDPDSDNLHAGVIIAALGLRYQSYASLVARTYMVDPTKEQESNYKALVAVHEVVLKAIRDGVQGKEVYSKALAALKSKKPDLEKNFPKSVGYGIGIETKDITLSLSAKSSRVLKDGMTLMIQTSFQDLESKNSKDKRAKTYSMVITDTVRVTADGTAVFTKDATYDLDSVCFFFNDDEEPAPKPKEKKKDSRIGAVAQSNVVTTRTRNERAANVDAEKENQRREHQKELHKKKHTNGLRKYTEGAGQLNGVEEKKFHKFDSYKREEDFPSKVKDLTIVADVKNQSIILPIMGRPVPFHINTIKNASTNPEGERMVSLRINFLSPGQGVGRKDDQPFEDANAHFVRSLTFRSADKDRMNAIAASITDMKKDNARREQEKKQLEDVIAQDKIILDRRPQKLDLLFVRPALDGKRVPGEVQIHTNGIRYVHGGGFGGQTIDVTYANIRHLFFQSCKQELIVIIHIHLNNPIMIGKRKTKDVQFYREATDMQFDETGNRKRKHRYGDEEEFEAEQEERRRRSDLDKQFLAFAKRIEEASRDDKSGRDDNLRVDVPFRDLGFNGVPARSSVWISPTTDCLVQLTEPPFMVVTLDDIEVVHLERVQFGLKNFDMVVVFKDFTRPPQHINTIPVESLDAVKDWLDSVEIPFSEGPLNLQWSTIMKTVQADPHAFFTDGGWSFLAAESDDEDGEESEEESAFEMSDDEVAASVVSSEDESDFDENASADASDEDASGEDSEGEDWDELEKKAKRKDRESGLDDEEEKSGGKKRKR
ncbi:SPT16-domain-containing protein [Tothia fuscella]|uniref:FACT complex subunit n=1 Tax=Tothia fuscella TaxID=1048955 RepID=A0A9P4NEA9_9PEZI|nr:SPT16-domain-containing protein [Tothia fuscella]